MSQAPQSILVINVTRIGDTLLAVPALRALAKAWQGEYLTGIWFVALYHCKLPNWCYGAQDHQYDFFTEHPCLWELCDETTPVGEIGLDAVSERLLEVLMVREVLHSENEVK